jgi:hypothetical protein
MACDDQVVCICNCKIIFVFIKLGKKEEKFELKQKGTVGLFSGSKYVALQAKRQTKFQVKIIK